MPYVKIDYTDNLTNFPSAEILSGVNDALGESDAIRDEFDLKSCVSALSDYRIGTKKRAVRSFTRSAISFQEDRRKSEKILPTELPPFFINSFDSNIGQRRNDRNESRDI
jgi:5-carboxymethyl-2-hydroxymuconate isomerase